eukprot:CAMPEP_0118716290 /NCGR_PEP_ID=MMETSP0800-20121206/27408_1 /TAXON_ID=210618 ORGANISM="Striatella unipunctata, Strain CCMP2910" /NCGR_SAMPLE_ID=MMETSP0800 /ASSEMBLY_ACC=CAM_ASM_000638 /LENGTH=142 /DNA_ID=CAMNT_0006622673 /DNA_START=1 /DNA_END=430 /DNA_ORIENTATION=-
MQQASEALRAARSSQDVETVDDVFLDYQDEVDKQGTPNIDNVDMDELEKELAALELEVEEEKSQTHSHKPENPPDGGGQDARPQTDFTETESSALAELEKEFATLEPQVANENTQQNSDQNESQPVDVSQDDRIERQVSETG